MAHIVYSKLSDLESNLDQIRALEKIREPKPGIFYFKSLPFLHFHEKNGKRWAHVKDGKSWRELNVAFDANKAERNKFLKEVCKFHERLIQ